MITDVEFGTMLTRNRDGAQKRRAHLWQDRQHHLIVPEHNHLHGRPVARITDGQSGHTSLLLFYPDRIEGFSSGQSRTLVRYDFSAEDIGTQTQTGLHDHLLRA